MSIFSLILLLLFLSQFYWAWVVRGFLRRRIGNPRTRLFAGIAMLLVYLLILAFNFTMLARRQTAVHLTLRDALLTAPFGWWVASSLVGFIVVLILAPVKGIARIVPDARRAAAGFSPAR